jgi:hypothetical protein
MSKKIPPDLKLQLRVLMAKQGIRSVAALYRSLKASGVITSASYLQRLANREITPGSLQLLVGLASILQCKIEDMIVPGEEE